MAVVCLGGLSTIESLMSIIAVDFDHVLVDGDVPKHGAKDAMNLLREHGHKVLIHSCNSTKWVKKVLDANDIRYDGIHDVQYSNGSTKPVAALYVDDRGYHFKGDWPREVHLILKRLEPVEDGH